MLLFCPLCSNMLIISAVPAGDPSVEEHVGHNRFECRTCPYQMIIDKRYYERKYIKKKEVDDVIGGKGAWDNVDQTPVVCPVEKCRNGSAYWYQLQIRSADEPMTAFYKCTKCGHECANVFRHINKLVHKRSRELYSATNYAISGVQVSVSGNVVTCKIATVNLQSPK